MATGRRVHGLTVLVLGMALAACGSGGGGEAPIAADTEYGQFSTETTVWNAQGSVPGISTNKFILASAGPKVVGGVTLQRMKLAYDIPGPEKITDPETKGFEVWLTRQDKDDFVIGGFAEKGVISGTLDAPLSLNIRPPIGVDQTTTVSGTTVTPDDPTPKSATLTAKWQLVSDNATVITDTLGTVTGCRHFSGTLNASGPGIPGGLGDLLSQANLKAEAWYHDDLGIVAGGLPDLGLKLGLAGQEDYGVAGPGWIAAKKVKVLQGTDNEFKLDTYDRKGELDATKYVHNPMYLELRWANEDDAKNHAAPAAPMVVIRFADTMGYFFDSYSGYVGDAGPMVESPVSVFHPEENGKGYKYWYVAGHGADKNLPGADGINYYISVSKDSILPPLRVTARIVYKLVDGVAATVTQ
jgi:hypothetical protein